MASPSSAARSAAAGCPAASSPASPATWPSGPDPPRDAQRPPPAARRRWIRLAALRRRRGRGAQQEEALRPLQDVLGDARPRIGMVEASRGARRDPAEQRSPGVRADDREQGRRVHAQARRARAESRPHNKDSSPSWKRLSFPLMWRTDVLEILRIAGRARDAREGAHDEQRTALDLLVRSRQGARRPLEASGTPEQPLRRRHRDEGRAEPLGDAPGAAGVGRGGPGLSGAGRTLLVEPQHHRRLDLPAGDAPVAPQQAVLLGGRDQAEAVALVEADRPGGVGPGADQQRLMGQR